MHNSNDRQPLEGSVASSKSTSYTYEDMEFLDDLEHVRRRAGTYIGDLGVRGLHHLVHEVIDNSLDEAMAGYATQISVIIQKDHSITISDNGRGIPVGIDPRIGKSALECVMTMLKYGGKFDDSAYGEAGGLNGMGMKTVNFLSRWCRVRVKRDGQLYEQRFEVGHPVSKVESLGSTEGRGTMVSFLPDPEKFGDLVFDGALLADRLQNAAFLNRGVQIELHDRRSDERREWRFQRGLSEWVEHQQQELSPVHPEVIEICGQHEVAKIDIAFRYHMAPFEKIDCYANNIHTEEGGTHRSGFLAALTRGLLHYGRCQKLFGSLVPSSKDFLEGLTAIISVRLSQPEFESQNKIKLTTPAVEKATRSITHEYLKTYWEENPRVAKAIIAKACVTAQARVQASEVRKRLMAKSNRLGGLPGKLRDCTCNDPHRSELYLVEGDSAGGSAEGGRLREFQAILPLRGKIINAFKYNSDKVLANQEVQSIIQALGIGVGPDVDLEKLRYHKVIAMSDADVDGSHIRTLLLCFFYRQMPELILGGHVYVAQPPLFRIRSRNLNRYLSTEQELHQCLLQRGTEVARLAIDSGESIAGTKLNALCQLIIDYQTNQSHQVSLSERLDSLGLPVDSFAAIEQIGSERPRFELKNKDKSIGFNSLNEIPAAVRSFGEQGIQVTRFKGLGEMNAEELRQTTLLPENRKLVRVTMEDAEKANEMFHLLMGVVVEPRRKFIREHALEAKLDV